MGCLRSFWIAICTIGGMLIGAGLLGLMFESWTLAAIGAVIGAPLGWAFGRFVPFLEFVDGVFGIAD